MNFSNLIFKTSTLGRCFYVNKCHRLLPTVTSFLSPICGLRSQTVIQLPEKPKKPPAPFFRFMNEHRLILKKENPQWKLTELVKKCSEDWKNVHATVKQRYEDEYKSELAVYAEKFLKYSANLTEEQKVYIKELAHERRESLKKRRAKKKIRDLNKPKKPSSPYTMYLLDQAKSQGKKYNELMKELKGHWELLDESTKSIYVKKSEEARKIYLQELDRWEMKMLQEGNEDVVRYKTLKEKRPISAKNVRKMREEAAKSTKEKSARDSEKKKSSGALEDKVTKE